MRRPRVRVMRLRFPMPDGALPLYVQCDAQAENDTGGEWLVTGIEVYSAPDYAPESLVCDDLPFDSLPVSSQMQLSAHIDGEWHDKRERLQRLLQFGVSA